eukprot:1058208-Amphidinium_carterae.1
MSERQMLRPSLVCLSAHSSFVLAGSTAERPCEQPIATAVALPCSSTRRVLRMHPVIHSGSTRLRLPRRQCVEPIDE